MMVIGVGQIVAKNRSTYSVPTPSTTIEGCPRNGWRIYITRPMHQKWLILQGKKGVATYYEHIAPDCTLIMLHFLLRLRKEKAA